MATASLFENPNNSPLADRLRPKDFGDVVGQGHLLEEGGVLDNFSRTGFLPSIILWGNPGSGKTTLAKIIARKSKKHLELLSAVTSGIADLKKVFEAATARKKDGLETILFIDEIHRFNRSQQDAFLPFIENGTIILIGATTENPSFELNSALLSRAKVLTLNRLSEDALLQLIGKAEEHYKTKIPLTDEAKHMLCNLADGDGRVLLNMCEEIFNLPKKSAPLNPEQLTKIIQKRMPLYDKNREGHYNLISALHKSMRGSDVNAALYYYARMLDGGEDPLYIARRLIRFASEDIGMADPQALVQAMAAKQAYETLGSPEGELMITQCVIYLSTAPKSNAAYVAHSAALKSAKQYGSLMPPKHILNAPTKFMKEEGYAKGYEYDHNTEKGFSGQNYFPEEMQRQDIYQPKEVGFERDITKRMEYWNNLREQKK